MSHKNVVPFPAQQAVEAETETPEVVGVAYVGAVLPYKPPIDKVVALCLLLAKSDLPIESILFFKNNECSPEQIAQWKAERIYSIDLGDQKYHKAGVASASAFVVQDLQMELSDGFKKLVDMIGKNNTGGTLTKQKFSVAKMMREIYELEDGDAFHIKVIERCLDVIEVFGMVENSQIERDIDGFEDALPELIEKHTESKDQPLTLGRYIRDLWLCGEPVDGIRKKISWWHDNIRRLQHRREEGERKLAQLLPVLAVWDVDGVPGIMFTTTNHFVAKAATRSKQWGVRIIGDGTGHQVISATGLSLAQLANILQKREPGCWYYQPDMEALINGGVQYTDTPPTQIKPLKLRELVQRHVRKK